MKNELKEVKNIVALIPCLNEEKAISKVIKGFKVQGLKEIIVADGHSDDNTNRVAKENGAKVIMVRRGKGNGFRDLLNSIKIEKNKYYIMIDGDYTYLPEELSLLVNKANEKNADVIMGKRPLWAKNHRNISEMIRNIIHIIGNLIISTTGSILYLKPTRDICTGYWLFKGEMLNELKNHLSAQRFELEADLFSTASKLGAKIESVPIRYMKRIGESKLRTNDAFFIIKKLFTNRFQ
jgi:dolichol-phosphate mannosyltransferase